MDPLAYYHLKAAQALFSRGYAALADGDRERAHAVARRYADIEAAVLGSAEAAGVCLAPDALDTALAEIRGRYDSDEQYADELAVAGLSSATLADALQRELLTNAVLDRVGAAAGPVPDMEAEIFYFSHLDRFRVGEQRVARHILVTINDDLPENRREVARERIDAIAARLAARPKRFEEQAIKHSECPTALNGGQLGEVPRGKLFPALDDALFALDAGQTSAPVESPLGFHVLRCDAILPARTLPYSEVAASLRMRLTERRAKAHAKTWLASLLTQQRRAKSTADC